MKLTHDEVVAIGVGVRCVHARVFEEPGRTPVVIVAQAGDPRQWCFLVAQHEIATAMSKRYFSGRDDFDYVEFYPERFIDFDEAPTPEGFYTYVEFRDVDVHLAHLSAQRRAELGPFRCPYWHGISKRELDSHLGVELPLLPASRSYYIEPLLSEAA